MSVTSQMSRQSTLDTRDHTGYGSSMVDEDTTLRPLTKMTLNLIPAAVEALAHETDVSGLSRTDVMNRAVQLYSMLMDEQRVGKQIHLMEPDTKDLFRVRVL